MTIGRDRRFGQWLVLAESLCLQELSLLGYLATHSLQLYDARFDSEIL
jgi:hypothetical protein